MHPKLDHLKQRLTETVGYVIGSTCPLCGRVAATFCHQCRNLVERYSQDEAGRSRVRYHGEVLVAFEYEPMIRKIILNFKYRNQRTSLQFLGDAIVERISVEPKFNLKNVDFVTWAPTTRRRFVERGYDQAELIARYAARQLLMPCEKLLVRLSNRPQTGKSRDARLAGPTFSARRLHGEHLLLIDDVVTTGATLKCASHELYRAGAGLVTCVAVASTVLWQSSIGSCAPAKARK